MSDGLTAQAQLPRTMDRRQKPMPASIVRDRNEMAMTHVYFGNE
jgi:hypothetical protein